MRFGTEEGMLSFLVRATWLGMRTALNAELKEYGLSTPQYATLAIVETNPGVSSSELGRKVGSSRQAANEMLAGLERDGLIVRGPHPADRRAHQIQLTDQGRALLAEARVAVARREAELEAGFTEEQRQAVRDWMAGIAEACS